MAKLAIYIQDEIHGDHFFEFLRKAMPLLLDMYINSTEYNDAVILGAEHISIGNTKLITSKEENHKYHLKIIPKNETSHDDLLSGKRRKVRSKLDS